MTSNGGEFFNLGKNGALVYIMGNLQKAKIWCNKQSKFTFTKPIRVFPKERFLP